MLCSVEDSIEDKQKALNWKIGLCQLVTESATLNIAEDWQKMTKITKSTLKLRAKRFGKFL